MNRFYWTNATLLLGVVLCQRTLFAQEEKAAGAKKTSAPDVVLSEVRYWPKEGEPEWIELTNVSDKAVDLKGWQLLDGQALDFVITETSFSLPPKGYLVVYLDGTGQPISLTKPESWMAHSPKGVAGNLLGDKGGQLALYSLGVESSFIKIRDYVAWGRSPGNVIADAVASKRWRSTRDIVVGSISGWIAGVPSFQQGGSIGLTESMKEFGYPGEFWGAFEPGEVNPGESGYFRRGPRTNFPFSGQTRDDGTAMLSMRRVEEGVKYQFQVCTDELCQDIFDDAVQTHPEYLLQKPVPKNTTYYWRGRHVYPDGSTSVWTPATPLTNGYVR